MLIRLTIQTLWRSPAFTAACVGTVALSIALASAVFAVVDGVLFKRLPYAAPDRLMLVSRAIEDPVRREQLRQGTGRAGTLFAAGDLHEWREARPGVSISAFVANFGVGPVAGARIHQETTWAARIDRSFFDVIGTAPLIGGFSEEHFRHPFEMRKLNAHPAIISYRLWRQVQADAGELPAVLRVGDGTLEVVGVLPPDFVFPATFARTRPDVLLPLDVTADQRGLQGVARLASDVPVSVASEQLRGAVLEPLSQALGSRERSAFSVTFVAVIAVVLLASLNVAVLLASRGRDRAGELAIRTALGAPPRSLVHLMLAEAVAIAIAGATLGVAAAKPALSLAMTMLPSSYLVIKPPAIDVRVAMFAIGAALATLLMFATWPALRAVRSSAYAGLRQGHGSTRSTHGWRRLALAAQSAIGTLVVLAGTLLVAGFTALWQEDVGLERRGTAIVDVTARAVRDPVQQRAMLDAALEIATRTPGVERVSASSGPFLRNAIAGSVFLPPSGGIDVVAQDVPIGSEYFETAGIRLLSGRFPDRHEIESGRALAVVSDSLARAFWPRREAVGQLLPAKSGPAALVVGVVEDVRVVGLEERQRTAEIYIPMRFAAPRTDRTLFLRAVADADETAKRVAAAIVRERPDLMITRAESVDSALAGSVRTRQFQSALFGAFAAATLLLLATGIAGAIAMNTASRTREIGVRMALGATASGVRRMVVAENLRPVIAGLLLGVTGSWWTAGLVASLIYGVGSHNPVLWGVAVLLVLTTATFAAWLSALPASRVDPQAVLRAQ